MLSARPWKLEAVIRLAVSVFLCFCAGYIVSVALPVFSAGKISVKLVALDAVGLLFLAAAMAVVRRHSAEGNTARRLALVLVCAYSGMLVGFWAQQVAGPTQPNVSTAQMLVAVVSLQGALLAFVPSFLSEQELGPEEAFGLARRWPRALAYGVIAACLFLPIGYLIQGGTGWLMQNFPIFPMRPTEQSAVHTLRKAASLFDRLALGGATIIVAPLAEEILFRGILYTGIRALGFPQLALWGTSIAFACVHFNLLSFPALLLLAVILTLLYERTGNLLAPIAAHSCFNALNLIQLYLLERQIHHQPY